MKEEMDGKKVRVEKLGNYAKYVREMHWPKTSKKKTMELELLR